jgi:hypothetical protein
MLRRCETTEATQGASEATRPSGSLRPPRTLGPCGQDEWRAVFGEASPQMVAIVDAMVADDLESVDPLTWT